MPSYDYYCDDCNLITTHSHGMTETPTISCPMCKRSMKRKISGGIGVVFNGSGWAGKDIKK